MLRRESTLPKSPTPKPTQPHHIAVEIVAGGGAGAISRTLIAPLERVKVLLQVQEVTSATNYRGIWDCLTRIPREQDGGVLAYWRGNGVNVARMIPNSAIKFTTFDRLKSLAFPNGERAYSSQELLYRKLLCGALSGVCTLVPVYPIDLIRTRLTADVSAHKRYSGVGDCIRQTVRQSDQGVFALYKGLTISLAGIIPYLAMSLTLYDVLKDQAKQSQIDFFHTPLGLISLGSVSALVSQTITFPLDTIRRRLQVSGVPGQPAHANTLECIRHVYRTSGVGGFYRGVLANGLRSAPQTGIEFACYDLIRKHLTLAWADDE